MYYIQRKLWQKHKTIPKERDNSEISKTRVIFYKPWERPLLKNPHFFYFFCFIEMCVIKSWRHKQLLSSHCAAWFFYSDFVETQKKLFIALTDFLSIKHPHCKWATCWCVVSSRGIVISRRLCSSTGTSPPYSSMSASTPLCLGSYSIWRWVN